MNRPLNNLSRRTTDFAVGFSRQPLPKGKHSVTATNAGAAGVKATDASTCQGFELAKLRPETLDAPPTERPPTANLFSSASIAERAHSGPKLNNTNGVKRKQPVVWRLGMGIPPLLS